MRSHTLTPSKTPVRAKPPSAKKKSKKDVDEDDHDDGDSGDEGDDGTHVRSSTKKVPPSSPSFGLFSPMEQSRVDAAVLRETLQELRDNATTYVALSGFEMDEAELEFKVLASFRDPHVISSPNFSAPSSKYSSWLILVMRARPV